MSNIEEKNVVQTLIDNYMPYTAYVIQERALPSIDGFKPSQRRILYTMMKMGLLSGNRKKSQGIVGQTMFLHPHGDASIYETMVRMARDSESLLLPFIDSKGNFGKQYSRDMKFASARYTEARLAPIAKELFKDINKNTVEMKDSYDGALKEPMLLPVTFPSILTNPQSGTAVGMASNIASFNLGEVIDFTIAYLKNSKTAKVEDYILAPDFPTGANIVKNDAVMQSIFDTGKGSFDIRASYHFEGDSIIFDEIPYVTTYEAIIEKIGQLVRDGKLKEVIDVDDIMGINGNGIDVTVKKNVDKDKLVEKLFQLTPLQSSFACNFNFLIDGRPKVLGVKHIVHEWIGFRAKTIRNGASFEKSNKEHKLLMLLALEKISLDVDKAISIIRETKKNKDVVKNLMKAFDITEEEAEYVAEIKLKHLNKEYLLDKIAESKEIEKDIKNLEDLLTNKKTLAKLIISELEHVKKEYGEERKTKVIEPTKVVVEEDEESQIENYNVKLFVTKDGYLKKVPLTSLRGGSEVKVKDGDVLVGEFDTTNNSEILVFTDKQNVYKLKTYDVENHKASVLGDYLPSVLGLKDEKVLYVTVTTDFKGDLIIGFEDGKVAKIELKAYETKQKRSMLKNAYANKKAIYFNHISEDIEVLAVSSINKALVFNTSLVNSKSSKTTQGSQAMKEKNGSFVLSYHTVEKDRDVSYYKAKSAGVGKYLKAGDFEDLLSEKGAS